MGEHCGGRVLLLEGPEVGGQKRPALNELGGHSAARNLSSLAMTTGLEQPRKELD